jgi:hypothetical protein
LRFSEIAARMTGLASPIFGVSWQPPILDITRARSIIAYLEDRRVLYDPFEFESPRLCIESVNKIREFLTGLITTEAPGVELAAVAQGMRRACRKFLRAVEERSGGPIGRPRREINTETGQVREIPWDPIPAPHDVDFNQALGELRGEFGWLIAALATRYGLDIEDELASILPADDE